VWRYVLETSSKQWMATLFLDAKGQLCIHSVYGGASHRFENAGADPRVFFARLTEDHHDHMTDLLASCGRPRGVLRQLVRNVFPRWRVLLRKELSAEQQHGTFTQDEPVPDPSRLPREVPRG